MKKVFFALLTIIVLIGLVACNPTVDRKLWDCKVTFDSNGGSKTVAKYINSGKTITEPANPSNGEKIFAGWYTTADWKEGKEFDFNTPITEDVTLYAKWWNPYFELFSEYPFDITPSYSWKSVACWNGELEYSTDSSWSECVKGVFPKDKTTSINAEFDNSDGMYHLYFRGTDNTIFSNWCEWKTSSNELIYCEGNVETLLDYELVKKGKHPVMEQQCFAQFFSSDGLGCEDGLHLASLPELPSTNLSYQCYYEMFAGAYIETIPDWFSLPATVLTAECYYEMFAYCPNLVSVRKDLLPSTQLADKCYGCFLDGCENLMNAPDLPATELAEYCYVFMFEYCTNLNDLPKLPAESLADYCYQYMFRGCSGITEIPENYLHAKKLAEGCYSGMFQDCDGIEYVSENLLPATDLAPYCYGLVNFYYCDGILSECDNLKNLPKLPATELATGCYGGMFRGCISIEEIPEDYLPAKTLANRCYAGMFKDCTGIETLPKNLLHAEELAENCYGFHYYSDTSGMFEGCENLKTLPKLPATVMKANCYELMFYGCSNLDISSNKNWSITVSETAENWNLNMFKNASVQLNPGGTEAGTYSLQEKNL